MLTSKKRYFLAMMGVLTAGLLFLGGCAGTRLKSDDGGLSAARKEKGPAPLYYDFGDVLVPQEMKLDKSSSFVFRS